jgi:hypothetical protein
MDAPVIEIAAPAREVLRDERGTITGTLEPQALTGKVLARDAHGVVGTYDPRLNETRDAHGRVIGRGNLLGALLLRWR